MHTHTSGLYKIGEMLRVICIAHDHEGNWNNGWASEMNYYLGKVGKLIREDPNNRGYVLHFEEKHEAWCFPSFSLIPASEPIEHYIFEI